MCDLEPFQFVFPETLQPSLPIFITFPSFLDLFGVTAPKCALCERRWLVALILYVSRLVQTLLLRAVRFCAGTSCLSDCDNDVLPCTDAHFRNATPMFRICRAHCQLPRSSCMICIASTAFIISYSGSRRQHMMFKHNRKRYYRTS